MHLANRVNQLAESQTIQMAKASRELAAQGHDVVSLSLGEPDFETPDHIKKAAKQAIDDGYTHYPPVPGYPELREAIQQKLQHDNQLSFDEDQILVSAGAKHSLANLMLALLNPGDEVLIPAPYWVSYPEMVKLAGGVPSILPTSLENDFKVQPEALDKYLSADTRLFLFSSPSNPTGSVYSKAELQQLAEVFQQYPDTLIISDEIYEHINYSEKHASIAQCDGMQGRTVIVNGVSKGFAMTGWRIGYLAAPSPVARACEKIQGQTTSGACSIAQKAAFAALTGDLTPTHQMRQAFRKRRDLVLEGLQNIEGIQTYTPKGAFYIFPDVSDYFGHSYQGTTLQNASDFCMFLLHEGHVALVTGRAFGNDQCVRLSYAASEEELQEALTRIQQTLQRLN